MKRRLEMTEFERHLESFLFFFFFTINRYDWKMRYQNCLIYEKKNTVVLNKVFCKFTESED